MHPKCFDFYLSQRATSRVDSLFLKSNDVNCLLSSLTCWQSSKMVWGVWFEVFLVDKMLKFIVVGIFFRYELVEEGGVVVFNFFVQAHSGLRLHTRRPGIKHLLLFLIKYASNLHNFFELDNFFFIRIRLSYFFRCKHFVPSIFANNLITNNLFVFFDQLVNCLLPKVYFWIFRKILPFTWS